MRFSINAEKMIALVSDVAKGVGNNKLLPITSMIGIKYAGDTIALSSFDGANLLRISVTENRDGDAEDGEITVNADMFIGLISKLSDCSSIAFEVDKEHPILSVLAYQGVKSIGAYKLELPLNEDGGIVKYLDLDSKKGDISTVGTVYELSTTLIKDMIASCKPALATDVSESCYTNYLVAEKIISTDRTRAVFLDNDGFKENDKHYLLGRQFVDLLTLMGEGASLYIFDDHIYATDGQGTEIVTSSNGALNDFNEKATDNMLKMEFPSMCKVKKSELLNTLNRMSLFCFKYDNNGIDITFDEDSMKISSLKSSAVEDIEYTEFKNVEPFDLRIDVTLLLPHVKSYASDIVELHFGNKMCIKLVDGSVTQIIALVAKS